MTRPARGVPFRFPVTASLAGERLDRAVALLLGLSRAGAARLVAEGKVHVGGSAVQAGDRRLRAGELVQVEAPSSGGEQATLACSGGTRGAAREVSGDSALAGSAVRCPEAGPLPFVVFADQHLVVVDKPAGLVVHPGAGNQTGTLVQKLVALFPDMEGAGPDRQRPGVVHRLDKGTSGLLVFARTEQARLGLVKQLAARTVLRRYLAVVYGDLRDGEGIIEAPLGRSPAERLRVTVVAGGRPARTHYRVLAHSSSAISATLVSCRLDTGRTHQIRAHFAAIGHPVLADERYSGSGRAALSRQALPLLGRPWLHASELGFVHPVSGKAMDFESVPPPELAEALRALGLGQAVPSSERRQVLP